LKRAFGADVTLKAGSGGIFDVEFQGEMVFSKHDQGRFPENEEIVKLLQGTLP